MPHELHQRLHQHVVTPFHTPGNLTSEFENDVTKRDENEAVMQVTETMRAVQHTQYGAPEVLSVREVKKPTPKDNEVLIRVRATSVSSTDAVMRKGDPFISRIVSGLTKPKRSTPGSELAGEIEAVGKDVSRFEKGDQVFGSTGIPLGAHAEYLCMPEDGAMAKKTAATTFEEAAACEGALTAFPFLRDHGHIQRGHKVLINGASGAVGTAAVQIAKYLGAEVTGVCSTENMELVRSLGADRVIDYTKDDFTGDGRTYDIIFDTPGKSSYSRCKGSLKTGGTYLSTVPTLAVALQMLWTSKIGNKRAAFVASGLRPADQKSQDLVLLGELIDKGAITPVIDKRYPLEQIAEAHRYVEAGKKGNVVIAL